MDDVIDKHTDIRYNGYDYCQDYNYKPVRIRVWTVSTSEFGETEEQYAKMDRENYECAE